MPMPRVIDRRRRKLPFKRDAGLLLDLYCRTGGRAIFVPGHLVGEQPSADEVDAAMARARAGDGEALAALPTAARPKRWRDALVASLEAGEARAALWLADSLDVPRVRAAVLAAARSRDDPEVIPVLYVLGTMRGQPAREILGRKLRRFTREIRAQSRSRGQFLLQVALAKTAAALLRVDPEHREAASVLVALVERPSLAVHAARALAFAFQRDVSTQAMRRVREGLHLAAASADLFVVLAAAPAAIVVDEVTVLARARACLQGRAAEPRWWSIDALVKIGSVAACALLLERLPVEPDLERAASIALEIAPLVPAPLLLDVAARALDYHRPFARWYALHALELARVPLPRRLARAALVDEPDPALRSRLAREHE